MAEPMKRAPFEKTLTPDMRTDKSHDAGTATPYGPHPHGVDEAAGGADSSPHDTEATGHKPPKEYPADDRAPCQQPRDW